MIGISEALRRALTRQSDTVISAAVGGTDMESGGETFDIRARDQAGSIQARHLVEIRARRRKRPTEEKVERFWDGLGDVSASITVPRDGSTATRTFTGVGALLGVPVIPRTLGLTVNRITLSLSQLDDDVLTVLQKQDARGARVTIWRAFFVPGTFTQIDRAVITFRGFAAKLNITTPEEGGYGAASLECEPDLAGLQRSGNAMRAAGSQRQRNANDAFYDDAGTAGEMRIVWGTHDGPVDGSKGRSGRNNVEFNPGRDYDGSGFR